MTLFGAPPRALMLALRDTFSADRFLETGTHVGATAAWAAEHFREVVTIEAAADVHREASRRHQRLRNVRFVLGDTRSVLPREVEALGGPAVVWLDSHWSGGDTHGEDDECPLLFEIETLRASPHQHFLFIDDARLFLMPPPRPHKLEQWPTLAQVTAALTIGDQPLDVIAIEDTFVAVPAEAKPLVWQYAQDLATRAWESRNTRTQQTSAPAPALRRFVARARRFLSSRYGRTRR